MAEDLQHTSYQRLGRGRRPSVNILALNPGEARIAQNCDRDHEHAIRKRNGSELLTRFFVRQRDEDGNEISRTFPPVVGIYNHEWDYPCRGPIHRHLFVLQDGTIFVRDPGEEGVEPLLAYPRIDEGVVEVEDVLTDYASFATVGGLTFIAIGKGRLRAYDGERLFWAGIEAPSDKPTTLVAGTGITGTYRYKYTFIRRTEDGQFLESSPSPRSDPRTASNQTITVTMPLHPNADAETNNGEYVTGYRIYRTLDLNLGGDPKAYFLVDEVDDVLTATYDDEKTDFELTDLAPIERTPPPDGTQLVIEHSKSLFCLSPRFNKLGLQFSEPGQYEAFPDANEIRLPVSSTANITGAGKIAGILVVTTEDRIFHISGSNPRDFIHREMNHYTGCLSPGSMTAVNNSLVFLGRNGFYSWDGSSLTYLSEDIEEDLAKLPYDTLRKAHASTYLRYKHYYCSLPTATGERRWQTYDISSEGLIIDAEDMGSARASRAWFEYTGMPATALAAVRAYTDREELLYWGDESGYLYEYDKGTTDAGRPITMRYQYLFKPAEERKRSEPTRTFKLRHVILRTDDWTGSVKVGLRYLRSPIREFIFRSLTRDYAHLEEDEHVETDFRFTNSGSGGCLVDVQHRGQGSFRLLEVGHSWKPKSGGRRHQIA